jgi:hypothetical protein
MDDASPAHGNSSPKQTCHLSLVDYEWELLIIGEYPFIYEQ